MSAPWEDPEVREQIRKENSDKAKIVYGPKELGQLIDETGEKIGVVKHYTFGWKPLWSKWLTIISNQHINQYTL